MKTVILIILIIWLFAPTALAQSPIGELPDFVEHQVIDIHILKSIFREQKNYQAEKSTAIICWGIGTYLKHDLSEIKICWTLDVVEGKINFVFNCPLELIDAEYFAAIKKIPWQLRVDKEKTIIHFEVNDLLTKNGVIGDFQKIWRNSSTELSSLKFLKNIKVETIFDQEKPKSDPRFKKIRYLPNSGFIF